MTKIQNDQATGRLWALGKGCSRKSSGEVHREARPVLMFQEIFLELGEGFPSRVWQDIVERDLCWYLKTSWWLQKKDTQAKFKGRISRSKILVDDRRTCQAHAKYTLAEFKERILAIKILVEGVKHCKLKEHSIPDRWQGGCQRDLCHFSSFKKLLQGAGWWLEHYRLIFRRIFLHQDKTPAAISHDQFSGVMILSQNAGWWHPETWLNCI